MGLDRIANFNIAHGDQNPRHPPCLSRERFIACYNVINLISLKKGETVNRKVTSSNSVAVPKPGRAEERSQGSPCAPGTAPHPNARSCPRGAACPSAGTSKTLSGARSHAGRGQREGSDSPCSAPAPLGGCHWLSPVGGSRRGNAALDVLTQSLWVQLRSCTSAENGTWGNRRV